jgi:quercetin dioxygenase-like cupin family protein
MIRAYRLYTGPDSDSHVTVGSIHPDVLVNATSIHFKETAAHSNYDWHNDPVPQYVLTLSGILEFTTKGGETFTLKPGDVLIAEDHTGTGHKWRLLNDDPWRRAYVIFAAGANTEFVPDQIRGEM